MPWDPVEGTTPEARVLFDCMSARSESFASAGWWPGTDAACWEAIHGDASRWGAAHFQPGDVADLARFSDRAGGWWSWTKGDHRPVFLTIAEWEEVYERVWRRS